MELLVDACGGFLAGKSIFFLSGSLPADGVWWSSRIWWYFLLQCLMLPPLCFTWRWCVCGWCAAFAASKHHVIWSTNTFVSSGQRPNFLPGDLGVCLHASSFCWIPGEVSTETFEPCSSPSKLLLVKNQAVWPIWTTEALTSFKVVAASLRVLLSCCVSLWGQQLQRELNLPSPFHGYNWTLWEVWWDETLAASPDFDFSINLVHELLGVVFVFILQ